MLICWHLDIGYLPYKNLLRQDDIGDFFVATKMAKKRQGNIQVNKFTKIQIQAYDRLTTTLDVI